MLLHCKGYNLKLAQKLFICKQQAIVLRIKFKYLTPICMQCKLRAFKRDHEANTLIEWMKLFTLVYIYSQNSGNLFLEGAWDPRVVGEFMSLPYEFFLYLVIVSVTRIYWHQMNSVKEYRVQINVNHNYHPSYPTLHHI